MEVTFKTSPPWDKVPVYDGLSEYLYAQMVHCHVVQKSRDGSQKIQLFSFEERR